MMKKNGLGKRAQHHFIYTLLGTNISLPKGTFEDKFPFTKMGYGLVPWRVSSEPGDVEKTTYQTKRFTSENQVKSRTMVDEQNLPIQQTDQALKNAMFLNQSYVKHESWRYTLHTKWFVIMITSPLPQSNRLIMPQGADY